MMILTRIAEIVNLRRSSSLAAFVLLAAFLTTALGGPRPDFNRPSDIDVQHYVLRVTFDRAAKLVRGDTTVVLRSTVPELRRVVLDAVGLNFTSVRTEPGNIPLRYSTTDSSVQVELDRAYSPDETISIRFVYTAKPVKGIYFVDAVKEKDRPNHSSQIWTHGEPDEARHWFPSFDFPSDKATTEQIITAETGETVIGNGELLDKLENEDGTTTWHYKMPVPHSTYLTSFVIGKYVRLDDRYGDLPLSHYVYPGYEQTGRNAFGQTIRMIPVFEKATGIKFPFNKYDQTIVSTFEFRGMENITATTMADTEIFWGEFEFGRQLVTDLVSHELAHSWFGNMVTCRNWAELWLNEGFATYMEAVYRESAYGRESYLRKIRADATEFLGGDSITKRRHGLFNLRAAEIDRLFDDSSVTYNKGGVVLHMLREVVGTEKFWQGVNIYLTKNKFGSVESSDLRSAMEEAYGQNLGWFFDQWVYSSGAPRLSIRPQYRARSRTLRLIVSQDQPLSPIVPAAFTIPLDVSIQVGQRRVIRTVKLNRRTETIDMPNQARPDEIVLDPASKVPAMTVKMSPIEYLR